MRRRAISDLYQARVAWVINGKQADIIEMWNENERKIKVNQGWNSRISFIRHTALGKMAEPEVKEDILVNDSGNVSMNVR